LAFIIKYIQLRAWLFNILNKVIHWTANQWITLSTVLSKGAQGNIDSNTWPKYIMGNDQKSLSRAVAKSLANEIKVKSPYL
jgi:hypothetical protein